MFASRVPQSRGHRDRSARAGRRARDRSGRHGLISSCRPRTRESAPGRHRDFRGPMDRSGPHRPFPTLAAPGHRLGPLQLRHVPGPAVWPQQRGDRLGPRAGRGFPYPPLPPSGVLSAGCRQVGPATRRTRRHHLFRPPAGLDPPAAGSPPTWPWRWMPPAWATALPSCRSASSTAARPSLSPGRSCTPTCRTPGNRSGSPCSGSSPAWSPPGHTVIVMTDRGLYARWLYREIVGLGWHPVMRITKLSQVPQGRARRRPSRSRRWFRGWGVDGRAGAWPSPRSPSGGWSAR